MENLHTKTFVIKNKKDGKNGSLHTKAFVIVINKKDERMKSLHIETFCHQQQEG
jgi:hypothetical protein